MSSDVAYRTAYTNGLQQGSIQQIPYFDVAIQRAGDKLERVVRVQDGRRYSICVTSNASFFREGRYDEPSHGRTYLHAGTDDVDEVTKRCTHEIRESEASRTGMTHFPSLVKTGGCLVVGGSVMETHDHDSSCSAAFTDVLA